MHEVIHRLTRRLGYLAKSITGRAGAMTGETQAVAEEGPLGHLDQESIFDYALATAGSFAYGYTADGVSHYALGKRDWAPITIATLLLAAGRDDAELMLECELLSHLGLKGSDERYLTWRDANDAVFNKLQSPAMNIGEPVLAQDEQFNSEMFAYLSPNVVNYEFRMLWKRNTATPGSDWLGVSNAHYRYQTHPLLAELHTISQYALGQFMQWLFEWYETRGIDVDKNDGLVYLEGYQPAFIVTQKSTSEF
jgi:hypothetical protein